jgi:hypothetical protein
VSTDYVLLSTLKLCLYSCFHCHLALNPSHPQANCQLRVERIKKAYARLKDYNIHTGGRDLDRWFVALRGCEVSCMELKKGVFLRGNSHSTSNCSIPIRASTCRAWLTFLFIMPMLEAIIRSLGAELQMGIRPAKGKLKLHPVSS